MHLTIGPIGVTRRGTRLSSVIEWGGTSREVWYSVPEGEEDSFVSDRCDGFVIGLLLQAMERGMDIVTNSPMSARLWRGLTHSYIPLVSRNFPHLRPIKLLPKSTITSTTNARGVATGFSGGVDSFATIIRHHVEESDPAYRVSHFLFHNVGSHSGARQSSARDLFNQRLRNVELLASELGVPLLPVDTNLADIFPVDFIRMHHTLNASVPLLLQNKFSRYYYASTYRYSDCGLGRTDDIARLDPLSLHLFSAEGLECVSTGSDMSRVEKTSLIARYEPSHRHLNVCADPAIDGKNCSVCFKCCRTMLTLEILGLAQLYEKVFDFSEFAKVRSSYIRKVLRHKPGSFEREIAELIMEKREGWIARVLRSRQWIEKFLGR